MSKALFVLWAIVSAGAGAWGWRQGRPAARGEAAALVEKGPALSMEEREKPLIEAALDVLPPGEVTAWARRIAVAQAGDFPALFREWEAPENKKDPAILRLLAGRWADLDPQAAWVALSDTPAAGVVLATWVQWDFDSGLRVWRDVGAAVAGPPLATEILFAEAPEVLWRLSLALGQPLGRPTDPRWAALVLAHKEEAEKLAGMLIEGGAGRPSSWEGWLLLESVLKERAANDPREALEWVERSPAVHGPRAVLHIVPFLARIDPEAAAEQLGVVEEAMGTGSGRRTSLARAAGDAAKEIGKDDPRRAVRWLDRVVPEKIDVRGEGAEVLSAALADGRLSPQEAMAIANDTLPARGLRGGLLQGMWTGVSATVLSRTAEWLKTASAENRDALPMVVREWGRQDSRAAMAFVETLAPEERPGFLTSIFTAGVNRGGIGSDAATVLGAVPAAFRAEVLSADLEARVRPDGEGWFRAEAFAEAVNRMGIVTLTPRAATNLCRRWAESDPLSAIALATRQTGGETQQSAVAGAMESWAKADSWGASQWLAAQPAGAMRDAGVAALARTIDDEEPDSAWRWAATIADPARREEAMAETLPAWGKADRTAAEAALESAGSLDPATRQRLLEALQTAQAGKEVPEQ